MSFYVFVFVSGLIVGSFVNVVIHRIPRGESIVGGRSHCPNCHKKIPWYDLIPLLSYFLLKRRCRRCGVLISWTYPLVETCSGAIFVVSSVLFAHAGVTPVLLQIFILELFLILSVVDLRHLILPDSILAFLLVGGLANAIVQDMGFTNVLSGALMLFGLLFFVWWFSRGRGLGFGDVKLAGIIGLTFGFWGGLIVLYVAIVSGALIGLFLLAFNHASLKTKLPLGTIICFSAAFYILGGHLVLERFSGLFYTIPSVLK